jgi:hypothetical protein
VPVIDAVYILNKIPQETGMLQGYNPDTISALRTLRTHVYPDVAYSVHEMEESGAACV